MKVGKNRGLPVRLGRPPLPPADKLHARCFRCTTAEWAKVVTRAAACGVTPSEWVRGVVGRAAKGAP